jgi:hypothetical protein
MSYLLSIETTAVMKLASCLLPAVLFALPLAASATVYGSATVYKWTDERGTTVFSNRPPPAAAKVSNVQVVAEDDAPAAAPRPDNGNALQERIRALEQQVQALQAPASTHFPNYAAPYPAQLPPPTNYYPSPNYYPPPDYYPPPSYPSAYPPPMYGYGYPYYPYAASYVVVEPASFVRPVHDFGGFRFGVHPMPLTHVMGVTYRR